MPRRDDLADRMARPANAGQPAAKPTSPYPHRVTLDLSDVDYRALRMASIDDSVPVSERLRLLIGLWRDRPELAADVIAARYGERPAR